MLTHRNLVNAACGRALAYSHQVRTCLLDTQLGWGPLLGGILWTFLHGGTALLAGAEGESGDFCALLEKHRPSHLFLRDQSHKALLARGAECSFSSVEGIVLLSPVIGGEDVRNTAFPSAQVWGEWGTAETAFCSCFARLFPGGVNGGKIGARPFPNVELYVLDPHEKLLPIWATGQIYIGGECVAHEFRRGEAGAQGLLLIRSVGRRQTVFLRAATRDVGGQTARWN